MKTGKSSDTITESQVSKDSWTMENALYVLEHPTVDSEVWSEAVEWLLLYGPPHIQDILLSASGNATANCFPDMKNTHYSHEGEPCYSIKDIAEVLQIEEDEARRIIAEKEKAHGMRFSLEEDETIKKQ